MAPSKTRKVKNSGPAADDDPLLPKPTDIIAQMGKIMSPESLLKVLEQTLHPALDAIDGTSRAEISRILQSAFRDTQRIHKLTSSIGYEKHRKSLEAQIKALEKDVKRDWKDGYERQGEMMDEIANEVLQWLPELWRVGVEETLEIQTVQKCLVLCTNVMERVSSCESRVEFGDVDFEMEIRNSANKIVYDHQHYSVAEALAWMWREMWITAIASQSRFAIGILDNIESLNLKDDVMALMRGEIEDSTDELDSEYFDMHWTPAMRDAASKLLNSHQEARIAAFESDLSGSTYHAILRESPHLKPVLLETLRRGVLVRGNKNIPSDAYKFAAQIFMEESPEHMLKLYDVLPSREDAPDLLQLFVKHFAIQESPDIHVKGLQLIEKGFHRAQSRVFTEVMNTFPRFDDAVDWLEERLREGKFSKKEPTSRFGPEAQKRDNFIDKFVKIAFGDGHYNEDFFYGHVDSDDSDYQEQMDARRPDLARPFLVWVTELCEWPQKEDAQMLWDRLKHSDDASDIFFSVDGVADSLASRCSYDYDHNGAKQHVSDGIKALYKTLRCPDLTALEKYQMKKQPSSDGFIVISVPGFE